SCDGYAIELIFLYALERHHRFVVLTAHLPGGMIDAGAFGENHLATQVSGVGDTGQTNEADDSCTNTISWTRQEAQDKGNKVEECGDGIEERMIEANATLG